MKVPEVVRAIIAKNKSVHDCIRMNIVNYTALAVRMQPEVEGALGCAVNLNTIVVAIKRYGDSLVHAGADRGPVLRNVRLSLVGGIMDTRIPADIIGAAEAAALFGEIAQSSAEYDLFQAGGTIRLLTEDGEDVRRILETFLDGVAPHSTGLVKIRITVPARSERTDLLLHVSDILRGSGIVLADVFFDLDTVILILKDEDAPKAYELLQKRL